MMALVISDQEITDYLTRTYSYFFSPFNLRMSIDKVKRDIQPILEELSAELASAQPHNLLCRELAITAIDRYDSLIFPVVHKQFGKILYPYRVSTGFGLRTTVRHSGYLVS